jgi:hypothetical protein
MTIDSNCVATCTTIALVGIPVLVPTAVALAYLPWCSQPALNSLELTLEPDAAAPAPATSTGGTP